MIEAPPTLPPRWRATTLGDLVANGALEIEVGLRLASQDQAAGGSGVPVIMPENIRGFNLEPTGLARAATTTVMGSERFRVRRGDIVHSRRGDLSRHALIDSRSEGWLCGCGCLRLRFDGDVLDPRFASYYFRQPQVTSWLLRRAVGSTIPHINRRTLAKLPIALPPYGEQREIADFLELLDKKLAHDAQLSEQLFELAGAHLQRCLQSISPEAVALGAGDIALPGGLRLAQIAACCERIENGRTPHAENKPEAAMKLPFLFSEDIAQPIIVSARKHISRASATEGGLKLWPNGTVVVALCGAAGGSAAWLDLEACGNQACCALVPVKNCSAYLYVYLSALKATLKKMRKGSAQPSLNQQLLAMLRIVLPAPEALADFERQIRPLLQQMAEISRRSTALIAMREKAQPQLFSGRLRFQSR